MNLVTIKYLDSCFESHHRLFQKGMRIQNLYGIFQKSQLCIFFSCLETESQLVYSTEQPCFGPHHIPLPAASRA